MQQSPDAVIITSIIIPYLAAFVFVLISILDIHLYLRREELRRSGGVHHLQQPQLPDLQSNVAARLRSVDRRKTASNKSENRDSEKRRAHFLSRPCSSCGKSICRAENAIVHAVAKRLIHCFTHKPRLFQRQDTVSFSEAKRIPDNF